MKKLLLPIATVAMFMLPAAANAAQCRNMETGKFAKCGSPGSILASQYVAKSKVASKTKAKTKAPTMAMPMPAATPAKPGLMAMMKSKMKPAATPAAKVVRCKNAKSKFVKCGTPGAKPV